MDIQIKDILLSGGGAVVLLMTLVQIAPIKINPWTAIARAIEHLFSRETSRRLTELEKAQQDVSTQLATLNKMLKERIELEDERNAIECRIRILQFGDELLHGEQHSKECFDQVLLDITEYERYCDTHRNFQNNVTTLTTQRIKSVYMHCLNTDTFI